jgi:hypothetical protein
MRLGLPLHALQRLDALPLGVDGKVVRPFQRALVRLRERFIFVF